MVMRIIEQARSMGEEIDIEDGFDLYRQLSKVRRMFTSTIAKYESFQSLLIP